MKKDLLHERVGSEILVAVGSEIASKCVDRDDFERSVDSVLRGIKAYKEAEAANKVRRQKRQQTSERLQEASVCLKRAAKLLDKELGQDLSVVYDHNSEGPYNFTSLILGIKRLSILIDGQPPSGRKRGGMPSTFGWGDVSLSYTDHLVLLAGEIFERSFEKKPGKSKSGPFVRFCSALYSSYYPDVTNWGETICTTMGKVAHLQTTHRVNE